MLALIGQIISFSKMAVTSYLKWEDMGIVTVPNMLEKGSMKVCPQLEEVKKLAARL